ncbi:MAG: helix-turn-helix transcriptional regulator [Bacilli bacterium]|nr:helix-turn-helix transcriptional regulator [Bacilli bacterium]
MNPEKIGQFIKEIRKKNNLTQADLAKKYGVTYQAVSKWENGKNLPDVLLIRQMSRDFNISVEDILDGEELSKKKNKKTIIIIAIIIIMIVLSIIIIVIHFKNNNSFSFKTLSSLCSDFKVTGSIAYDKNKSSIYISDINYCGKTNNTIYKSIECNLYENNNNNKIKISSCQNSSNITLENYLKDVKLNVEIYEQACKNYDSSGLYLEINAKDKDDNIITYNVPLNFESNCSN